MIDNKPPNLLSGALFCAVVLFVFELVILII